MFYNENLYHMLCSCTNLIFGKNLVPEIQAKMLSVNPSAGFFKQLSPEQIDEAASFFTC